MSTGLGIDPSIGTDGTKVGTSGQDIRRIFGSLYTEGVISGAEVVGTTGLSYKISAGLINLWYAGSKDAKESVMVPIPSMTVVTSAGPSSGTRTDYVWVRQNPPGNNTSTGSQVTVGVSSSKPSSSPGEYFIIAQFTVPAGMTATSKATRKADRTFSVPYGSGGLILNIKDTYHGRLADKIDQLANLTGSITLPTDQTVEFTCGVTAYLSGSESRPLDAINAGLTVDGYRNTWWTTPPLGPWAATYEWSHILELSAGTHQIEFRRSIYKDKDNPYVYLDSYSQRPGSYMYAKSVGVVE